MCHQPSPPAVRQFNAEIQFLLKPHNPHARSLLAFIRRSLKQFRLDGHLTEIDIFTEAYLRGIQYLQQADNSIRHPKAWMRITAYNVIRELHRNQSRYAAAAYDDFIENDLGRQVVAQDQQVQLVDAQAIDTDIYAVFQALRALPTCDRILIGLKVINGLSWREIRQWYGQWFDDPAPSEAALRKRGQRALERLRQQYHRLRPPHGSDG